MSSLNLGEIPNESVEEILNKVITQEGLTKFTLSIGRGSAKGDNYLGEIYRVHVEGTKNERKHQLDLIVKTAPSKEEMRLTLPINDLFGREIYAYTKVLKKFQELQDSTDLRNSAKFNFVKCYAYSDVNLKEMLVMADLRSDGFIMYDRLQYVDFAHSKLALCALARLHAFSFVLKKREPLTFDDFARHTEEAFLLSNPPWDNSHFKNFMMSAAAKAKSVIRDPTHLEKFEAFADNAYDRLVDIVKPGKYAVFCHGDFWINNMLFNYKDGKPVDVRLLDYQIMRYSTPATDLLYFIFCCSGQELRLKHYEELLDIYHDALKNHLEAFSYDVNRIYPKNEFLNDVKKTSDFGLGMAIMTLVFFTCGEDNVPDVNDIMKGNTSMDDYAKGDSFKLYEERMLGVVADYVRYGYL